MAKKKNTRTTKRTTTRRKSKRKQKRNSGRIVLILLGFLLLVCIVTATWCYIHPEYARMWRKEWKEMVSTDTPGNKDGSSPPNSSPSSSQQTSPSGSSGGQPSESSTSPEKGNYAVPEKGFKDLEFTYLRQTRREQVIRHTGFMVSYNEHWRLPNWVGYELTREKTGGKAKRQSRFLKDPHIEGTCPIHADYTKSGYDRGHMAAAADMAWSEQTMKESFYLSNVCPQHPDLNRRKWKELEDKVRDWAVADSAIIIVCGPVVAERCETIGKNSVSVPYQFFKVILSPYTDPPRAIGFLFDNQRATGSLGNYAVTVDSVERVTGLNFFSSLPEEIEEFVEKVFDPVAWGI